MSHLAFGIRTCDKELLKQDIERSKNDKKEALYLLGTSYSNILTDYETFLSHFQSIGQLTYRKDFDQLIPYEYTSDAGWGCMLRSGQMILFQTLQRHYLGETWRVEFSKDALDPTYCELLRWFVDSMNEKCIYSLHRMLKVGFQYDKLPGEWYGPTTVALVLRDLVNLHDVLRHEKEDQLEKSIKVYVPQDGIIYSQEVDALCSKTEDDSVRTPTKGSESIFHDPLLNPPQRTSRAVWDTSLLLLIPLRLGLDEINETYIPALKEFFRFPQSVGIIGGKRSHSVYFVGSNDTSLFLLDPHTVHPTATIDASFPAASHLRTMHASTPLMMDIKNVDPSLALGFYLKDRKSYIDFCQRISELSNHMTCPFSIAGSKPDHVSEAEMDFMVTGPGSEKTDEEDEYILV